MSLLKSFAKAKSTLFDLYKLNKYRYLMNKRYPRNKFILDATYKYNRT